MLIALWTKNPKLLPPEYSDLVLCRLFSCRPSQLDEEDSERIGVHLAMYNAEQTVINAMHKQQAGSNHRR